VNETIQEQVKKKIKKHKPFSETIKYLSREELKRLIESIDDVRDRAILRMLYSTGCRVGELCKAYVDDLDFEDKMFNIPAHNTKSKRGRKVRVHDSVVNDVRSYLKAKSFSKGLLFPISIRQVQNIVKKYGDKAGIEKLHPHTLRHTHIVHSLMSGVPMSAVQKQVGHIDLRTTQIYSNLSISDVKEAYKKTEI
jgi:integrase